MCCKDILVYVESKLLLCVCFFLTLKLADWSLVSGELVKAPRGRTSMLLLTAIASLWLPSSQTLNLEHCHIFRPLSHIVRSADH